MDAGEDSELGILFESLDGPVLVGQETPFGLVEEAHDGLCGHCHYQNCNEDHCECFVF